MFIFIAFLLLLSVFPSIFKEFTRIKTIGFDTEDDEYLNYISCLVLVIINCILL